MTYKKKVTINKVDANAVMVAAFGGALIGVALFPGIPAMIIGALIGGYLGWK